MEDTNQSKFDGWARVEVMGHQTHIGYVTTQAFGQAVMFRIDQPAIAGVEETLERAEWVGEIFAQPGSVVKREDVAACSVLVGSGSIYRIIPCDESAAMKAIRVGQSRPLIPVKLVERARLSAAEEAMDDEIDALDERSESLLR